ncbi:MAG TPA: AAA family ATPase [Kofleriaceae bacterium]|nr:AAA family ATPase [Kofleriaceae bacterium]
MLEFLRLENVGPAPSIEMELAPRLNLLTGDNGLGKSFLLDVAWWALTQKWPQDLNPSLTSGYRAMPRDVTKPARIGFRIQSKTKPVEYTSTYSPRDQRWVGKPGRPANPGLVIYAHADGGFSVWDPARNYWKTKSGEDIQETIPAYVFTAYEVWWGREAIFEGKPVKLCRGLVEDWSIWIREKGELAAMMTGILNKLSASGEQISVGPLLRLSVNDARDIPSIKTAYADAVRVVHASAGMRRIMGLAYMLLWSWEEHVRNSELTGDVRAQQVTMIFDEIESHLHPRWQRTILKSVLNIMESLHLEATVQLIAATHSPLILASAEPLFDSEKDKLFTLSLQGDKVLVQEQPWSAQGDVANWLVSDTFGLKQGRSFEAERAIEAAEAWMRGETTELPAELATQDQIHAELLRVLAGHDSFWPRWVVFQERAQGS